MQHLLTPYSKKIEPFAWWDGAFTEEQLDWLQQTAKKASQESEIGGVDRAGEVNESVRRSRLDWLHKTEESEWVFTKLAHVAASLNANYFGFDLTGFGEPLQLTSYSEANQGTYKWHQDFGGIEASRKLSMVLQLSNPEEYEGGNLEIMTNGNPTTMDKKRGTIAVFPAWTLHQVTPVTRGGRQTLVAWVSGAPFK